MITAPSMTTPAVTYVESATSNLRAGATIVVYQDGRHCVRGRLTRRCRTSLPRLRTKLRSIGLGSAISHRDVV